MPPFVISLGDPAGVGPEVVAKAWQARAAHDLPPFIAVGDMASIRSVWTGPVAQVDSPAAGAAAFADALPVWHIEDSGALEPGTPTLAGAHCALHSLELCVGLARSGEAAGVVTAPVCKDQLYQVGFTQSGQTEFVADRCGVARSNAVMMLAGPGLRVVPVTIHIPFGKVVEQLTEDLIVARGIGAARGLAKAFGIDSPRMAVAALNPHGGENGALGDEETSIIAPAIARLQAEGIDAFGPVSPDALFAPHMRPTYDVALCMYHDQALIPLKALHFDDGVNVTLGLPIIRTSPDHGTAFNIAGKGMASPGPMIAAIAVARDIACARSAAAGE